MGIALAGGYYFAQKIDKRAGLTNKNSKLRREKKSGWMNFTKSKEKIADGR
jgi:hypothetical protein